MNKIGCLEDVQGAFIRKIYGPRQALRTIDLSVYRAAHKLWMTKQGLPLLNVETPLAMEINHGRWNPMCPRCNAGITTGRLWAEVRCFGCGAVYLNVVWPEFPDVIESVLMKRPPNARHWNAHESIAQLLAENVQHGLFTDLRKQLPASVQALLSSGPPMLGEGN